MVPMKTVRPLRELAGDLAEVGRAIGATVARARSTFEPHRVSPLPGSTCEAPGCGAPATYPCICEAHYCEAHYLELTLDGGAIT